MSLIDSIASRIGFIRKGSVVRRAMPPQQKRDFSAAQTGRLFGDWSPTGASKNDKIETGLVLVRRRSRDMAESNEYAINFLGKCKTNIVGPDGIPMHNRAFDFVRNQKVLDKLANGIIGDAWQDWCKAKNCTVTGDMSFTESLYLAVETEAVDGEFLTRIVRGYSGNEYGFALQHLEADCLDETYRAKLPNGGTIRMGVERDQWRRAVRYHLRKENPNDMLGFLGGSLERIPVPAEDIIHKFIRTAPNQVRGFPWLAGAMESMHMLAAYDEASIVAARNGACKGGFWQPTQNAAGDFPADEDERGNLTQEVSPGQIDIAEPGYNFVPYDPTYPHDQYPAFVKANLRKIASALRVSYNGLANDLEGVNYSSIRAGLLDERDIWKLLQRALIQNYCERVFSAWLEEMLLTNKINLPLSKLVKFDRPKFIGRGWAWVDPEKDVNASILALKNKLTAHSFEVSQNFGGDFEEILQAQESDRVSAGVHGVSLDDENDAIRATTLGTQVRSGLITPQMEDEQKMREELGMPPLSPEAKDAWAKDKVRRPITLQNQQGFENAQDSLAVKPAQGAPAAAKSEKP